MSQDKILLLEKKIEELTRENNYLRSLLNKRSIEVERSTNSIIKERMELYRSYFKGREDVYAQRWFKGELKQYSPVIKKQYISFDPITKKRIILASEGESVYEKLTDEVIFKHLSKNNNLAVGLYVIANENQCFLAAIDFDGPKWQEECSLVTDVIEQYSFSYILERSQSGQGAHIWFFFQQPIKAKVARQFCSSFLTLAMKKSSLIKMSSYDRIFPTQDTVPKKGFGNLIALPLEGVARQSNNSVFIDKTLKVYEDQWDALKNTKKISEQKINSFLEKTGDNFDAGKVGIDYKSDGSLQLPIAEKTIEITLENGIKFSSKDLEPSLINHLKRVASFKNPEFYKAQKMRLNTWGKPRIICCAEIEEDETMIIPRGCLDSVINQFNSALYDCTLVDKRSETKIKNVSFKGTLYEDQQEALSRLIENEIGLLVAPPGFGKTVVASALIATRSVATLIIVHTKPLLKQWEKRLKENLDIEEVGLLASGVNTLSGVLDVAIINSLATERLAQIAENYAMVIVDEAHHAASYTYEQVLKRVKTKYVFGLTATPIRYDGKHHLAFMQCGPIIHNSTFSTEELDGIITPHFTLFRCNYQDLGIAQIYNKLTSNEDRNKQIVGEILKQTQQKRSILVLSNRIEQLQILNDSLEKENLKPLLVTGGQTAKVKREVEQYLKEFENSDLPPLILSTGKYIGEGFDFPRLDTLVFASPVAWKGNIIQYVGRVSRTYKNKKEIRVIDFVDFKIPILMRMFAKRVTTYNKLGFTILSNQKAPSEKVFFNETTFWEDFKKDVTEAKSEIVLISNYHIREILEILNLANQNIKTIFITETIPQYTKSNIEFVKANKEYPLIAAIDRKILWHGQFIVEAVPLEISFLRIEESTYVDDFIQFLNDEEKIKL